MSSAAENVIATDRRANLIGSLWMVLAMAAFGVEDVFVKAASQALPASEVMILFGLGGALVFSVVARLNGQPLYTPDVLSRPMRIRACFEVSGRLFYVLALALTPLSTTTVILQATPLVVVAGAALVFGETVGWRRWAAILIGLAGVIVTLRPGSDSFSPLTILAVLGMIGFAGRDLASRAAPRTLGTALLGLYGFLAIVVAGVLYALWEAEPMVRPDWTAALLLAGAIGAGSCAYASLMKAMRTGEVSAVTPFRYTRLLFGLTLGVTLFNETLDVPMLIGSGLIVLSGLFILWRGKAVRA